MSKAEDLHQCPCDPATKCLMDEPCLGCETYSKWINIRPFQKKEIVRLRKKLKSIADISHSALYPEQDESDFPLPELEGTDAQILINLARTNPEEAKKEAIRLARLDTMKKRKSK